MLEISKNKCPFVYVCDATSGILGAASKRVNCSGSADGNYELTCTSYETCTGGVSTKTVQCPGEAVFNKLNGQCDEYACHLYMLLLLEISTYIFFKRLKCIKLYLTARKIAK